jgi:two-component SAPR family response regulator
MPRLGISLLGPPYLSVDGVPLKISSHRAIPLLAYLATTDKAHSRESIAYLLWSEGSLPQALASLRTSLWRLKTAGLEAWISLQNNEIALDQRKSIEVDVQDFRAHLEKCKTHGHSPTQVCLYCIPALTEAIELYRGEFMAGFNLSKAPAFEDWRMQEGEILHLAYI